MLDVGLRHFIGGYLLKQSLHRRLQAGYIIHIRLKHGFEQVAQVGEVLDVGLRHFIGSYLLKQSLHSGEYRRLQAVSIIHIRLKQGFKQIAQVGKYLAVGLRHLVNSYPDQYDSARTVKDVSCQSEPPPQNQDVFEQIPHNGNFFGGAGFILTICNAMQNFVVLVLLTLRHIPLL